MKSAFSGIGAALAALALFEVSMQPSWKDRIELSAIFLVMAATMTAANWWLPRRARRNRSFRLTIAVLALTGFVIVVGGTLGVANRMFLSQHDLKLLLVVLAFGMASAVAFALTVSRTFTTDLDRLADTASSVARGSLDTRADLDRRDELGQLADSIDLMIDQLDRAEMARHTDAVTRREFFAAVGHDLRTPLASLQVAIEAFQDGMVEDPDAYFDSMNRDVAALSALVDDVFLLARIDSGQLVTEMVAVDLTEIADEAIDLLRPLAARQDVEVALHATDRVMVEATSESVSRVMRNLIDNAIRHAPPGSAVSVKVLATGGQAIVRVVDEGSGFSEEFIPVAFDRFTREDSARARDTGGSGLGLAIAQGVVNALDGEIWAEPGPGGRVGFCLPVMAHVG
jgi:signal transduction histidine kinase